MPRCNHGPAGWFSDEKGLNWRIMASAVKMKTEAHFCRAFHTWYIQGLWKAVLSVHNLQFSAAPRDWTLGEGSSASRTQKRQQQLSGRTQQPFARRAVSMLVIANHPNRVVEDTNTGLSVHVWDIHHAVVLTGKFFSRLRPQRMLAD